MEWNQNSGGLVLWIFCTGQVQYEEMRCQNTLSLLYLEYTNKINNYFIIKLIYIHFILFLNMRHVEIFLIFFFFKFDIKIMQSQPLVVLTSKQREINSQTRGVISRWANLNSPRTNRTVPRQRWGRSCSQPTSVAAREAGMVRCYRSYCESPTILRGEG